MRIIALLLAMTACLAMAVPSLAGGASAAGPCLGTSGSCGGCGCHAPCKQVTCQIICDYEEVKIKCWDVKCEDYCLPIPVLGSCLGGRKSCERCSSGCNKGCGPLNDRCGCGKCEPAVTCGKPRVKKRLMLRTIIVKKPVYKCVTRYLCDGCEVDTQVVAPQESAPAPAPAPAPKAAAVPKVPLVTLPKQAVIPRLPRF